MNKQQLDAVNNARYALSASLTDKDSVDLSWIQPPPPNDGWTLASDALIYITRIVKHIKPRHILEFGSGLSTRTLARACGDLQSRCYISSVDHDPEFSRVIVKELDKQEIPNCRVKLQISPLVARDCGGRFLPFYHLNPERFASKRPVDLVLIDGPPGVLGGREGMLYQAMEFSHPGTILLLDDAERKEEKEILKRWQDNFKDAIEVHTLPGFIKGMASVIIHMPILNSGIWEHRLRLCSQEIDALIPRGENFILIDQSCWDIGSITGREPIPFLEWNGQYYGPPSDDETAIMEVDRLRKSGANFLIFSWPAFWWLEYYADFYKNLQSQFRCILNNDRLVIFDLRTVLVTNNIANNNERDR